MKKELVSAVNQRLLFWVLLVVILHYGRTFLVPLVFAALLAMLMAPLCRRLDRKMSRAFSTLICVFIVFVSLLIMMGVLAGQIAAFTDDLPQLKDKLEKFVYQGQSFIEDRFNISEQRQKGIIKDQLESAGKTTGKFLGGLLGGFAAIATSTALTLVYTFLLLYHKEKYSNFFLKIFSKEGNSEVKEVIEQISDVSQKYLFGRVITILILIILYSIGLLIVGVDYAILVAAVAGLLAFIPYVGTIAGGFFPILMALVTGDVQTALWAGAVIAGIQAVDNYFIEPYLVGGEVNLSALTTILAIISGGLIWGAAGMILFIPLLGITKIIFDHIDQLKPYGYLIGDPGGRASTKVKDWFKKTFGGK